MIPKLLQTISARCALLLLCLSLPVCGQAQQFSSEYDEHFQEAFNRYLRTYLPNDQWMWFKAQCIQESRLKPYAISPAGAAGLCQLMKSAASDCGISPDDRYDPHKNIMCGAWILRRNLRTWFPRDTLYQRLQLAQASYNAGAGHIIKAQRNCGGARLWADIAPCLHLVTGYTHSTETIRYVILILQWYRQLILQSGQRWEDFTP